MLKKVKTSRRLPNQPSLKNIMDDSKNINRNNELFPTQNRETFELSYLVRSPHYNQDKSYTYLVNIIQKYNTQTLQKQNLHNLTKNINILGKKKLPCIRLIYRQLLIIAVMEKWQIQESGLPLKIKIWYQNLGQNHSFLQGINMKKRKQNIHQRQAEEKIRSTYISNVFDEINDYMRRQVDFTVTSQKDTAFSRNKRQKNKKDVDNVTLPLIDLIIYKREDSRLQQYYFKAIVENKNQIREKNLLKLKNIQNLKPNLKMQEQCQNKNISNFSSQCNFYPFIKRSSFIQKNPLKTRLEWFKLIQKVDRLSLSNINGINLINYKTE